MNVDTGILWPVAALAAWTLCMLLLMAFRRIRSALDHSVHPREYALGESERVPDSIALVNRNYMNLLELPVLFHVACILAVLVQASSPTMIGLAWAYVALRVVHSLVHVTCNRVVYRLAVFAASNVVLIGMWILLVRAF